MGRQKPKLFLLKFLLFAAVVLITSFNFAAAQAFSQAPVFSRNLSLGSVGNDVTALQQYLNTHNFPIAGSGPGSPGNETTKFGFLTKQALIKFQEHYAAEVLTPSGLTHGTGNFFAATRNFINRQLAESPDRDAISQSLAVAPTAQKASSKNNPAASSSQLYSVGGTVTGLTGSVTLVNGGDNLVIVPGGSSAFTFPADLTAGQHYAVSVSKSPSGETCFMPPGQTGSGIVANANIIGIKIQCTSAVGWNPFVPLITSAPIVSTQNQTQNNPGPTVIGTAYVTNYGNNTVTLCTALSNGTLGTCTTSTGNATFNGPVNITINSLGTYAYVTNFNNNTISQCAVNGNLTLGTCTVFTDPTFNNLEGVVINSLDTFLYASNVTATGTISICPIGGGGALGSCTAATGTPPADFGYDQFIGLQKINGTDYLYTNANAGQLNIAICPVNDTTGAIGNCASVKATTTPTEVDFASPQGISFYTVGGQTYAYIGNGGSSTGIANYLTVCPINTDGSFGTCTVTQGNGTFNFTNNVSIGSSVFGTTQTYIYVPNNGSNTISICPLNSDGSLGTCVTSSGNSSFNIPSGIFVERNHATGD